jgi:hypothetical protein
VILKAAEFWAQARQQGQPTADDKSLDGDVILAAQAVTISNQGEDVVIATTNVDHRSRFVQAKIWKPVYLEIEQVQANPLSQGKVKDRIIRPIGKWLIWYATRESLQKCIGGTDGTIAVLTAKDKELLIEYYSNTVQMEYQGPDTIAPGEDGHVFTFSRQAAEQFCTRQEQWGLPAPL